MEKIVIDTNILVNAFRKGSPMRSKAKKLIEDVYRGKYEVYLSHAIEEEYRDVFRYKRANVDRIDAFVWLKWVRKRAYYIEPKPTTQNQVEMRDEDDRKFFDVAKCVGARLITRNYKDYPVHELITLIDELY